jgi:hypothetical protein
VVLEIFLQEDRKIRKSEQEEIWGSRCRLRAGTIIAVRECCTLARPPQAARTQNFSPSDLLIFL